jgi:hypothetical protein
MTRRPSVSESFVAIGIATTFAKRYSVNVHATSRGAMPNVLASDGSAGKRQARA